MSRIPPFLKARIGELWSVPFDIRNSDGSAVDLSNKSILVRVSDENENEILYTYNSVDNPTVIYKDEDVDKKFHFDMPSSMFSAEGTFLMEFELTNEGENFKRKYWFEYEVLGTLDGLPVDNANQADQIFTGAIIVVVPDMDGLANVGNAKKGSVVLVIDADGSGNWDIFVALVDDPAAEDWLNMSDEAILRSIKRYGITVAATTEARDGLEEVKLGKGVWVTDEKKFYLASKDAPTTNDWIDVTQNAIDLGITAGVQGYALEILADASARSVLAGVKKGKAVWLLDVKILYLASKDNPTENADWIDVSTSVVDTGVTLGVAGYAVEILADKAARDGLTGVKKGKAVWIIDTKKVFFALQDVPTADNHWVDVIEASTADLQSTVTDLGETVTAQGGTLTSLGESVTAAQTTADTAEGKADTAITNAGTAQTAADTADGKADTAITNAATAQATAETADGKADGAISAATTAQTAAETADGKADTAIENAATAQAAAETADGKADTAITNAATAQAAAETADGKADTAITNAETAQTAAETADGKADGAVTAATNAQATADAKGIGNIKILPEAQMKALASISWATFDLVEQTEEDQQLGDSSSIFEHVPAGKRPVLRFTGEIDAVGPPPNGGAEFVTVIWTFVDNAGGGYSQTVHPMVMKGYGSGNPDGYHVRYYPNNAFIILPGTIPASLDIKAKIFVPSNLTTFTTFVYNPVLYVAGYVD